MRRISTTPGFEDTRRFFFRDVFRARINSVETLGACPGTSEISIKVIEIVFKRKRATTRSAPIVTPFRGFSRALARAVSPRLASPREFHRQRRRRERSDVSDASLLTALLSPASLINVFPIYQYTRMHKLRARSRAHESTSFCGITRIDINFG